MGLIIAFAAGFVVGARTGKREYEDVTRSVRALVESQEFADVVSATRSHLGHSLRELAGMLDGTQQPTDTDADGTEVVNRVRSLFARD